MSGEALKISDDFCRNPDFGIEQALARHVRNRWPSNTLDHIGREWGLSTGEARGVLYAQASRRTLNKIIRHRRGGWKLWIELIGAVTGVSFDQFLETERTRLRHERERAAEEDRRLGEVVRHLRAVPNLGAD
jgi:hypothetical protein